MRAYWIRMAPLIAVAFLGTWVWDQEARADEAPAAHAADSKAISTTGVLDVVDACDIKTGRHETHYYLGDLVTGRAKRLRFERTPDVALKSGDIVRLRAYPDAEKGLVVPSGQEKSLSVMPAPESHEKAVQNRRSVVLLVNFTNKTLAVTKSQVSQMMFDTATKSVDGLYRESSYGQSAFPGDTDGDGQRDVFGPFTIPYSSTSTCDYYNWGYAAEDKAIDAGVDFSLYQHIVYVFPGTSCGWAGMGNVGCGSVCRVWVNAPEHSDVYAHELGHNLGMRHAATDLDNNGSIDSEYGDTSDILGTSGVGLRQLNAPHKVQVGWFNSYPGQVVTVTQSGTYRIAPLEMKPSEADLPQVLKVASATSGESYYLGFRVRMGYDTGVSSSYADGCSIHRFRDVGGVQTRYITTLRDGGTFTDTAAKLTVKQVAHSSSPTAGYLDLQITVGTSTTTDKTKPTVASAQARDHKTVRVTFSEDMKNDAALVATNQYTFSGTPTLKSQKITRIDARNVDVTVNEMKQGAAYSVIVGSNGPADLAGNKVNSSYTKKSFYGVGQAPTVTIARLDASPTNKDTVRYSVTFSEPVGTSFTTADLAPTGSIGVGATFTISGTDPNYTVTEKPTNPNGNGTVGLRVTGTVTDAVGNKCVGGLAPEYTMDNKGPTVSVGRPSSALTRSGPVSFTVTYSGANNITLNSSKVSLTRTGTATGTVSVSGSGTTSRTVTVNSIAGSGTIGISVTSGSATDPAGNSASASLLSSTFVVDNTAPTLTLSAPTTAKGNVRSVRYTVGFKGADTVALNASHVILKKTGTATGKVTVSGTGTTSRTVTIGSLGGSGTLAIAIASGAAKDKASNLSPATGTSKAFSITKSSVASALLEEEEPAADPDSGVSDFEISSVDIQRAINAVLGLADPTEVDDTNGDGVIDALDVQNLINQVLAG